MITILVYILLVLNAFVALIHPWIGVVSAYLVALLTPQNIWWWAFDGLRPSLWTAVPAVLGVTLAILRGKIDLSRLNTTLNWCVFTLFVCMTIAYLFGPYVDVVNQYRFFEPDLIYSNMQKTLLLYLLAVLAIDSTQKLKVAAVVIVVTTLYMTYWANAQYLFHDQYGRLRGPVPLSGESIYADQNMFSVLFVAGFPFLYYFAELVGNRLVKWGMLAVVALAWHAVFLTASRGALLGIVAILLVYMFRAKSKIAGIVVLAAFAAAFVFQAGEVMKERSQTITEFETEASASQRLDAWSAAIRMMADHPVTGVGLASFGQAFPDYSEGKPKIAHNTFFQIGGEFGVIAAIAFLVLAVSTLNRLRRTANALREVQGDDAKTYFCLAEACLLSLIGFFVCSIFLSLESFEVLYYLLALSNGVLLGAKKLVDDVASHAAAKGRVRRRVVLSGDPR